MGIKAVSFDMDGTLVDDWFVEYFWFRVIPELYAEKYGIGFEDAWRRVVIEYDEIGDRDIRWYLPEYWIERFRLDVDLKHLMEKVEPLVKYFEDVEPTLAQLHGRYIIVVASNASKEFVEIETRRMRKYIDGLFSSVTDLNKVRKDSEFYRYVAEQIGVKPPEVLHVGDNLEYDYYEPRKIGMKTLYINREREEVEDIEGIHSLLELLRVLGERDP